MRRASKASDQHRRESDVQPIGMRGRGFKVGKEVQCNTHSAGFPPTRSSSPPPHLAYPVLPQVQRRTARVEGEGLDDIGRALLAQVLRGGGGRGGKWEKCVQVSRPCPPRPGSEGKGRRPGKITGGVSSTYTMRHAPCQGAHSSIALCALSHTWADRSTAGRLRSRSLKSLRRAAASFCRCFACRP